MAPKKILVALLLALAAFSSAAEPTAASVMAKAQTEAKAGGKNVLVIFHASWCGWCKHFDAFLADPDMGKLIKKQFVVVHLTVQESEGKKNLENPGGEEYMVALKGKDAGLPFFAFVDGKGKMLINSNSLEDGTKGNTGSPASPEEIAHFIKMLEKGAPKISKAERESIAKWMTAHAPKR